ncbi:MAG: 50S ribosomal protein L2 [Candidatus ainarchaeum sp.]|nr:50S ribosomal protein L2 [Candidatus ainarchaeum sp.]
MGKALRQQKAGKGSPAYRRPSHRFRSEAKFRPLDEIEKAGRLDGEVVGFVDAPERSSILMDIVFSDRTRLTLIAPEGAEVGGRVSVGSKADIEFGNVLPLGAIPEGLPVYNIEVAPGDGGKLVRASGGSGTIVSREKGLVYVKLPSKKVVTFDPRCRAQVGVVCGGGRLDAPMLKAGTAFYKHHALNRRWPHSRGVKMNAYNHPFGGKQHHKGKSSCVSHGTPPGRKVGHIGARSTGRRSAKMEEAKLA